MAAVPCNSVYLDYGVDSADLGEDDLSISDRGIVLHSQWQFSVGTQIVMKFHLGDGPRSCDCALQADGIVVECDCVKRGCHRTTLLFLEIPLQLQTALRAFSDRQESRL